MARVDQIIVTVDVVDIYVIVVVPIRRPRFGIFEIITAIIKAAVAALHMEMMRAAKTGSELLLRNAPSPAALVSITSVGAVVVLPGLLGALLVLRTILLLSWLGLVTLVLLLRAIILLRGLLRGLCRLVAIAIILLLLLGAII